MQPSDVARKGRVGSETTTTGKPLKYFRYWTQGTLRYLNRANLKRVVENCDTRAGWWFDVAIQGLIVVSLISFSVSTIPTNSPSLQHQLGIVEAVTVALFTAEYLLRLYVADSKVKYAFSFFGLVDLLSVAPFYLPGSVDLRALRLFRLFRVVQLFKLLRYNHAIKRFHIALQLSKEELILFFSVTTMLLYASAVGIYYFENRAQPEAFSSIFSSLWWSVSTLTTVGYGDIYPVTVGGRFFTFVMLMIGLGIIAVPSGLVATSLAEARRIIEQEAEKKTAAASNTTEDD